MSDLLQLVGTLSSIFTCMGFDSPESKPGDHNTGFDSGNHMQSDPLELAAHG